VGKFLFGEEKRRGTIRIKSLPRKVRKHAFIIVEKSVPTGKEERKETGLDFHWRTIRKTGEDDNMILKKREGNSYRCRMQISFCR